MHPQKHNQPKHSRTQFQIDRIAFFSDAVIAIAITLMVLEIKIPELGKDITYAEIFKQYGASILMHTLALLIGFLTIGTLWIQHHELFEHITDYNQKLVKSNLYFLLTVILLPITISFFYTDNEPQQLQRLLYFTNLLLCRLSYGSMLRVVFHKKNNFSMLKDKEAIIEMKNSALYSSLMLFFVVLLVCFNSEWFYAPFIIVPVALKIYERILAKSKNKIKTGAN